MQPAEPVAFEGCSGRAPATPRDSPETRRGFAPWEAACGAWAEVPSALRKFWAPTIKLGGCVGGRLSAGCRAWGCGMWPVMEPVGKEEPEPGWLPAGQLGGCPGLRSRGTLGEPSLPSRSPPSVEATARVVRRRRERGWFLGGAALRPLTSMQTFPRTPVWVGSSRA